MYHLYVCLFACLCLSCMSSFSSRLLFGHFLFRAHLWFPFSSSRAQHQRWSWGAAGSTIPATIKSSDMFRRATFRAGPVHLSRSAVRLFVLFTRAILHAKLGEDLRDSSVQEAAFTLSQSVLTDLFYFFSLLPCIDVRSLPLSFSFLFHPWPPVYQCLSFSLPTVWLTCFMYISRNRSPTLAQLNYSPIPSGTDIFLWRMNVGPVCSKSFECPVFHNPSMVNSLHTIH